MIRTVALVFVTSLLAFSCSPKKSDNSGTTVDLPDAAPPDEQENGDAASRPPDKGNEAGAPDARSSVPPDAAPLTDSGKSACSENVGIGRFCVIGDRTTGALAAGTPLQIGIVPDGCHSSSCVSIVDYTCTLKSTGTREFSVTADFCLNDERGRPQGCSADCGRHLGGLCQEQPKLEKGSYVIRSGSLELAFDVPSDVPAEGYCAGTYD